MLWEKTESFSIQIQHAFLPQSSFDNKPKFIRININRNFCIMNVEAKKSIPFYILMDISFVCKHLIEKDFVLDSQNKNKFYECEIC